MSVPPDAPDRGHLIWVTLDPQVGREQAGRRPALVLSAGRYNRGSGLCVVCPITSRAKGYSFEVALPDGLPVGGVVLTDHVKSVDWAGRGAVYIGEAPAELVAAVLVNVLSLLRG